ncbi:zinc finger protein 184-like [Folsomia candida]|uniref:Zinc finger protein 3 n=1 Tax=Folsomia candida TaxID=158441 RepID=A0A226D191_FOLCA|nr:zinc finger protein 184-like [Folsomia candida]XP_035700760.1 zinc finger protein 184-like [Folsomia candida]OXA38820.1 Zinc finger protein 3 [Folsomia candida]
MENCKLYPCMCQNCEKTFPSTRRLNIHLRRMHPSTPRTRSFKCDICPKDFYTSYYLSLHKKHTHSTLKPFGCTECEKSFKSKLGLRVHISSHKGDKAYACPHCPKILSSYANWRRHTYIHTKSDNDRKHISCPHENCHVKFEYPCELKHHISRVHSTVKLSRDHKCSSCSAAFFDKNKLRRHEDIHTRDPARNHLICYFCPKSKARQSELTDHMRKHTQEKPYRCPLCERSFSFLGNMTRHIFTHTKEKPFSCSVCEKGFSHRQSLRSHVATHTREKRYSCKICDYTAFHRTSVSIHVRRIHYRVYELQCDICLKRLFSQAELNLHVEMHFKVKPVTGHPCYLCQVRFGRFGDMKTHLRLCTGEKRIKAVVW